MENKLTLLNDVAILKLKTPVNTTTITYNKALGYPSVSGTQLTVIGFGQTSNKGSIPNTLQKLQTFFVPTKQCQATYGSNVVQANQHICADIKNAGDCYGDR